MSSQCTLARRPSSHAAPLDHFGTGRALTNDLLLHGAVFILLACPWDSMSGPLGMSEIIVQDHQSTHYEIMPPEDR